MGLSRASSKKRSKKSLLVPSPPPILLRADSVEEYEERIANYKGSSLLVVVSPLAATVTSAIIQHLEAINDPRPAWYQDTNVVVVYATPETAGLCQSLHITAVPFIQGYSYGEIVADFVGDNIEKIDLVAKLCAKKSVEQAAALAEQKKREEPLSLEPAPATVDEV